MDANGLRFWQLADPRHFPATQHVAWDAACRVLRLASERTLVPALSPADAFDAAQEALERIPRAIDTQEGVAHWDVASNAVVATSYLPGAATLLPLEETPSDLCTGHDGVLYAALSTRLRLHDLRGRWDDENVRLEGFSPWRMTPAAGGGVWVMERTTGRLARLAGRPLRRETPQPDDYDGRVFRPEPENGCAPALTLIATPALGTNERPLAIAALPGNTATPFAVLCWLDGEGVAAVRTWIAAQSRLSAPLVLQGANYAYSIVGLSATRIALRVPGRSDAPAFDLATANAARSILPRGEIYPLCTAALEAPFANGVAQPPHYPSGAAGSEPLFALSLNNIARHGEARNFDDATATFSAWLIDSKDTTTVWDRVYAEAVIPAHTGFVLWLAATNEPRPPAHDDLTAWHAHGFGADIDALDAAMAAPQLPHAVLEHFPSELSGSSGLLGGERDVRSVSRMGSGLWSVLIQNSQQRVRKLSGRYLWVRVVMHGDGRVSPEIAALRAWGSRFSYADKYLPRIYRESLFGEAAQAPGERLALLEPTHMAELVAGPLNGVLRARLMLELVEPGPAATVSVERAGDHWLLLDGLRAWRIVREMVEVAGAAREQLVIYRPQASPADFTARMLGNFEGVLTQLEDRVAAAHLYSDPASVPAENLEWLGNWIGVAFDPALPDTRRRDWLRAAPELARLHGTRNGLRLALDVATGGGVRGGEIVVLEDFRLRRILATLLGVDMSEEHDPLLPGLIQSGNSIVGATLVIGDHDPGMRSELAALFNDAATSNAEDAAALDFYEKLANRATVFVHREVEPQDFALIRRIVQLEAPAHVEVKVLAASWPLLVGIASLVGVDTYLATPRARRSVQVERSVLGMGDFVIGQALLDPRLSGRAVAASVAPPVADAGTDTTVSAGSNFILDARASHAASGRAIEEYRWRLLPPDTHDPEI